MIAYPQPIITVDQTIRLVELAVSSKTKELEQAVAMAIQAIVKPPMIYVGDIGTTEFNLSKVQTPEQHSSNNTSEDL